MDLRKFISILEKNGDLLRIKQFVNPVLQISEITDRISKTPNGGKALLFENTGTKFPVLINAMGSYQRMCNVLGVNDLDQIGTELEELFKTLSAPKTNLFDKLKLLPELKQIGSWMPKVISGKGKCQEVIDLEPDITQFPVLKCWQADGGRFITLPMVNTKDPHTNIRNIGMYRMQIFDKQLTGMHWHKHKVGARHYQEYKTLGKKMPIAVALGGDLIYTYCATAPLPDNIDEYMLAGFLRKKNVELVRCITQDIEVPADADIIIEGYVDTSEDFIWEGPFGDHTGFYSLPDWYPKFHITCITHRKDAIYPATIVGIPPQEDAYIAKATERIFLMPIKLTLLPEIVDIDIPVAGVAHNLTIVKIRKMFAGHALKVMNALWGAGQMMFNKILVVVDGDINIHDYLQVAQRISQNADIDNDIYLTKGVLDVLDHAASRMSLGGKMGVDATTKMEEELLNSKLKVDSTPINVDSTTLKRNYSEITAINCLSSLGITIIALSELNQQRKRELSVEISKELSLSSTKILIFTDKETDIFDVMTTVWICANNIDFARDAQIHNSKLVLDAMRKNLENDGFQRDWPNVIVTDEKTIQEVDSMWNDLNIGEFISSPSLKFRTYIKGMGAAVEKSKE